MKKTGKLLALLLALVMLLANGSAVMADNGYEALLPAVHTIQPDFTGKTVILHSNDVHGALEGYACIAALRDRFLACGASDVILADAGDFSQGTIYVSTSKGYSAIQMMNAAGYDIVTPGNHEFDFGYGQLTINLADAEFTVISADIYGEDGELILPASAIIETENGLKIGFFGMGTPETATKVNPGLIREISFATFDDLYASAQLAVEGLEEAEADIIIGLCHLGVDIESAANGYRSLDLLENVAGIDFVIDGHSHTVMTEGLDGEPIQSAGTEFEYIGVIVIDDEDKAVEDNYLLSTAGMDRDADVAAAAQEIIDAVDEQYGAVFATSEVFLNGERAPGNRTEETNLGDLIADAMVWSVVKEGGLEEVEPNAVVGVTNGGGIRASVKAGDVTMKDINTVLPFGNTVAVVYVTGEELLEALEASTYCAPDPVGAYPQTTGIEWVLDTTVPYDQGGVYSIDGKDTSYYAPQTIGRVSIISINGEAFDPYAVYAVVTNNFCAAGGDTYNVFNRAYSEGAGFDTGIPMDEAVAAYIDDVLDGVITADAYGEPSGRETQIRLSEAEAEVSAA